jgi:hypothetical protein
MGSFSIQATAHTVFEQLLAQDSLVVGKIERDVHIHIPARVNLPFKTSKNIPILKGCIVRKSDTPSGDLFLVQGKPHSIDELEAIEKKQSRKFSPNVRKAYLQSDGMPEWDGQCQVLAYILDGAEVVDRIAGLPRNGSDAPLHPCVLRFNEKGVR